MAVVLDVFMSPSAGPLVRGNRSDRMRIPSQVVALNYHDATLIPPEAFVLLRPGNDNFKHVFHSCFNKKQHFCM